jgi:hypothetical protein
VTPDQKLRKFTHQCCEGCEFKDIQLRKLERVVEIQAEALEKYRHFTLDERPGTKTRYSHAAEVIARVEKLLEKK